MDKSLEELFNYLTVIDYEETAVDEVEMADEIWLYNSENNTNFLPHDVFTEFREWNQPIPENLSGTMRF